RRRPHRAERRSVRLPRRPGRGPLQARPLPLLARRRIRGVAREGGPRNDKTRRSGSSLVTRGTTPHTTDTLPQGTTADRPDSTHFGGLMRRAPESNRIRLEGALGHFTPGIGGAHSPGRPVRRPVGGVGGATAGRLRRPLPPDPNGRTRGSQLRG